jgi:hypothetical protein
MTAYSTRGERFLRLVLRLDQAGSAAFIIVALATVPAFVLLGPMRALLSLLELALIAYAMGLGVLGVFMACGLARLLRRGEELPPHLWRSMLMFSEPVDRRAARARHRPGSPAGRE